MMRRRLLPALLVASLVLAFVEAAPAAAVLPPACVDLGIGPLAASECSVPTASLLFVPGTEKDCPIPGSDVGGVIVFAETEPRIVERLPIAPDDWADVKALNDYYRLHAGDYGGQVRFFWKICANRGTGARTTIGPEPIAVPITDPLLNIRFDVEALSLRVPLPAVALSTLPEPDVFYGLKVNNPAWLGVTPGSWRSVTDGPRVLRGWAVTLTVRPVAMTYTITQGGTVTTVPCDPATQRYVPGSRRFPTEPDDFTDEDNWLDPPDQPLPTRDCVWTPRRKGTGTVAVAVTYDVTAAAGGFLFRFTPRVNTTTSPIEVNELRVVNTRP